MRPRGRYAPTPSGDLHLGNARTALLAWLSIRARGGTFVLRMEDLDKPREKPMAAERILASLRWLGLDWDEGPDVGGPFGPYLQSERSERYDAAVDRLVAEGKAFACWCSRAEISAASRAPHLGEEGPRYPGTCRELAEADSAGVHGRFPLLRERQARTNERDPSIRLRVPAGAIDFVDGLRGPQAIDVDALIGDFVIRRTDGIAAYQLAVAVDDAAMEITEVLRGDDLLSSTPRQLLIYDALGLRAPSFLHVPLVLGPDGARLAKRHGAPSLQELEQRQEDPKAVCGFLASISGLARPGERLGPKELIQRWDPERLATEPARIEVDPFSR